MFWTSQLKNQPNEGKFIFTELFEKVKINNVLTFLDEKSTLRDEISLFLKLSWKPFIIALFYKIVNKLKSSFLALTILVFSSFFWFISIKSYNQNIEYTCLIIGLFTVGIPHGALDHYIQIKNWKSNNIQLFFVRYIVGMLIMVILWLLSPIFTLILFYLFSCWHFGQADGKEWNMNRIISLFWGFSVLAFILGTHSKESAKIIQSICEVEFKPLIPIYLLFPWVIYAIYNLKFQLFITLCWLLISTQLSLVSTFGLYFIGQHSLTSWKHIKIHLEMNNWNVWKKAIPFHFGAWIFFALLCYLFKYNFVDSTNQESIFGIIFIFLSCISLPHIFVMNSIYLKNKQ